MVRRGRSNEKCFTAHTHQTAPGVLWESSLQIPWRKAIVSQPEHQTAHNRKKRHCKQSNKYTGGIFPEIFLFRNNSHHSRACLQHNITFANTKNFKESQTHSLSMEKQVTGPSAVQVAVLKTSLQENKHCICQLWKTVTVCHTVYINTLFNTSLRKGEFLAVIFELASEVNIIKHVKCLVLLQLDYHHLIKSKKIR